MPMKFFIDRWSNVHCESCKKAFRGTKAFYKQVARTTQYTYCDECGKKARED